MKNSIQNQKGIALITTLMLVVLGFAIVAIMLGLATRETKLARLEQGYTTALDAAKGATDFFIFVVQNGFAQNNPPTPPFGATFNNINCLRVKMSTATSLWTGPVWAGCPQANNTTKPSAISSDPTDSPDMTLVLGKASSQYTVNVKIIDNTVTQPNYATTPCYLGCYYYTVVAQATSPDSNEHADISFMYRCDK